MSNQERDLARPEGLSAAGNRAYDVIMATMSPTLRNPGGCKTFYSPQEWKARGEEYGHDSELIVVYDGGCVRYYFEYDGDNSELIERMHDALGAEGLYAEPCTCWYGAIYAV